MIRQICALFFENLENGGAEEMFAPGVFSIDELRAIGKSKTWCPYCEMMHFAIDNIPEFMHFHRFEVLDTIDPKGAPAERYKLHPVLIADFTLAQIAPRE
eukprot:TRINITY_DN15617_c0_g1::TRINITY_DN15617_c0_g1_i1::g.28561::m.28561 TRINITY_DN15617_c0_g1::TRINITY_DN15617_c0_g1_i1::g.28561  ORF type:complete len:100 (+),score=11.64,sp/Q8W4M7/ERCC2_ARATH/34.33/4e-07,DEAD_2/PF06733.10/0.007,Thioredoxin_2/PF13098.1/0.062 TRINITY_DN15617_c0_g1_i1:171-470(+)